jgi:predicted secreted protein
MRQLIVLFAFAATLWGMQIQFDKKFTDSVNPDLVQTAIIATASGQDEQSVSQILQRVSVFIDGYSQVKKSGGNLQITPEYNYEQGQKILQGYNGRLAYEITAEEFDSVEVFLQDLLSQKEEESITVRGLGYTLSKEKRQNRMEKLRFQAILWGISYAKNLSSKIYQQCKVDKIDFEKQKGPVLLRSSTAQKQKSKQLTRDFIPNPVKEPKLLYMQPNFVLKCSDDR